MACPCGNARPLEECCGPFLKGEAHPETAEQLMRSRYAAFTLEEVDYILATHHPRTRKHAKREEIAAWARDSEWLGLEIVSTDRGGAEDQEGGVEFIARYRAGGNDISHHEHSQFQRVEGHWRYLDGKVQGPKPVVREAPKVGRNDPCPCGSGRKFKKCCGP